MTKGQKLNRTITTASVVVVFMLILIGGIVRSTGAGMGCPDWPKCFGKWAPDANSQLITWIEYSNRVFGAVTGLFVLAAAITSLAWWKRDKAITILSISALLLIGFEGLVGAKVVFKNLEEYTITVHLALAYILSGLLLVAYARINYDNQPGAGFQTNRAKNNWFTAIALAVTSMQILLGTFVRAEINTIIKNNDTVTRGQLAANAHTWLPGHRMFSGAVILACLYIAGLYWQWGRVNKTIRFSILLMVVSLAGQFLTGTLLYSFGFPAYAQPLHILFSSLIFGGLVLLLANNNIYGADKSAQPINRVHYA